MLSGDNKVKFVRLLRRYVQGKATPEEAEFVNRYYDQFEQEPDVLDQLPEDEKEQLSHDMRAAIHARLDRGADTTVIPMYRRKGVLAMAAVVTLTLVAGGYWFVSRRSSVQQPIAMQQAVALPGQLQTVHLADNTIVRLAPGSKLQYPAVFNGANREVALTGEAFFEVSHDSGHPFIIHAGEMDVKVLGTTFNVKAYPEDNTIETSLIEGAVEIRLKDDNNSIVLKPNQKFVFNRVADAGKEQNSQAAIAQAYNVKSITTNALTQTVVETDWITNRLSFDHEPLQDIAARLERWYDVKVVFDSERVKNYKYTASFSDQRVDDVLKALQLSKKFNYKKEDHVIHIY